MSDIRQKMQSEDDKWVDDALREKMKLHINEVCRNFSFQHVEKIFEIFSSDASKDPKQKLRIQEYFIAKLFECLNDLPMPILIHNKDFLIMFANKAYLKITEKSCDNLLGRYYGEFFPEHRDTPHVCVCKLGGKAEKDKIQYKIYSFPMEGKEGCYQLSLHFFENIQKVNALVETVQALSSALEQRDPYTAGHQKRVALLAKAIAIELALSEEKVLGVELGALIHDIGKIHIPLSILSKSSILDPEEYEVMKTHVPVGYQIIKNIHFPWPIKEMILQHHERLNGSGYPKKLMGNKIIQEARIITIADVTENILNIQQRSLDDAINELSSNKGTLFDPEVVGACIHLLKDKAFSFEGS